MTPGSTFSFAWLTSIVDNAQAFETKSKTILPAFQSEIFLDFPISIHLAHEVKMCFFLILLYFYSIQFVPFISSYLTYLTVLNIVPNRRKFINEIRPVITGIY